MMFQANEDTYLQLIRRFLAAEIGGESFCAEFLELWQADCEAEPARGVSLPERQLVEAFNRGDITVAEFIQRGAELWWSPGAERLPDMLDQIFILCDAFDPNPEGQYEIGEEELKREVEAYVTGYELGRPYQDKQDS